MHNPAVSIAESKGVCNKKIVRRSDGRPIGQIKGRQFIKAVKESLHLMRNFDAWGLDCSVFETEVLPNCEEMIFKDRESGRTYKISAQEFKQRSFVRAFGNHGEQYFCPRKFWQIQDSKQMSLFEVLR